MSTFKEFMENINSVISDIENLLQQCQQLPDTDKDTQSDLWAPQNYKQIMIPYYKDLLNNMDNTLAARLSAESLKDDPQKVYRKINSGGHPIRDYLILKANNLI